MLTRVTSSETAGLAAEALPFGVAIADPHGIITWANPAYAQMTGCTADKLLGQSAGEFDWDTLAHTAPSSEPWRGKAVHRRTSGDTYPVEHSITTLRSAADEVTGFWIMLREITGLEREVPWPSHAQAGFSALIESTEDIIWSVDLNYRLLTFNKALYEAFERSFGVRAAVGMGPDDLLPHERAALFPPLYERVLSDGPYRTEYSLLDGRTLELSFNPIRQDGETTGISVFGKDITQAKAAEKALREAEATYRSIFDNALEGIYRTSIEGKALTANPALAKMLGYESPEEGILAATDVALRVWFDPNERSAFLKLLQDQGVVMAYECQLKRKDGTAVWASVNSRIVKDIDGTPLYIAGFVEDITERKRAEATIQRANEAIAERERHYRRIFNGVSDAVFVSTLRQDGLPGTFIDVNDRACEYLGYSRDELLHMGPHDITAPEVKDMVKGVRDRLVAVGHGLFETINIAKNGKRIPVEVNAQVFMSGGTRTLLSSVRDISERKRMQNALRRSEEKFAKAFLSSPAIIALVDLTKDGRFVDVNEAFELALGYRREEAIGRTATELGLWSDLGEYENSVKQFSVAGRLRNFEHQFRRNNGDIGVGLTSTELIELDGKPFAISATIDITGQRRSESSMRSLATAIEQTSETVVITDLKGTILYCNPAFEKITGYSKEEAIGQNPRVLKSGKHCSEFYERMWTTITQGKVWTGHLTNKKKDGSFYEEDATISPIRDASGALSGFVAVKRDVTERLQLENQLRQAQKLESIGRLAGGVAHDFNNLLTVINGYSGFLLKGLMAGDPLRDYANEIKTAGERAAGLTRQLLAFSRRQMIESKVFDLNALIRQSVPMLARLIGEDITLETALDDSLGLVLADPDQIHQVIMNLAVNARDAMPDGGRLAIETQNVEFGAEAGATIRPDTMLGRCVLITVTDNGHGMDEMTRQQVFEPFFTTKGAGKGTGLGLATVYGIIRQSGGWIDVWSEIGVGTSFKVYLPRTDSCTVSEGKEIILPMAGGVETILVVEDQDSVRSFAVAALSEQGYHVIEASDGNEAIAVAGRHSGSIHLLVTDVVMPGMDGRRLSERLKEVRPNLKVLFISGYTADLIASRGVLDRDVAFLQKPFSPDALAGKVREVLGGPFTPLDGN